MAGPGVSYYAPSPSSSNNLIHTLTALSGQPSLIHPLTSLSQRATSSLSSPEALFQDFSEAWYDARDAIEYVSASVVPYLGRDGAPRGGGGGGGGSSGNSGNSGYPRRRRRSQHHLLEELEDGKAVWRDATGRMARAVVEGAAAGASRERRTYASRSDVVELRILEGLAGRKGRELEVWIGRMWRVREGLERVLRGMEEEVEEEEEGMVMMGVQEEVEVVGREEKRPSGLDSGYTSYEAHGASSITPPPTRDGWGWGVASGGGGYPQPRQQYSHYHPPTPSPEPQDGYYTSYPTASPISPTSMGSSSPHTHQFPSSSSYSYSYTHGPGYGTVQPTSTPRITIHPASSSSYSPHTYTHPPPPSSPPPPPSATYNYHNYPPHHHRTPSLSGSGHGSRYSSTGHGGNGSPTSPTATGMSMAMGYSSGSHGYHPPPPPLQQQAQEYNRHGRVRMPYEERQPFTRYS